MVNSDMQIKEIKDPKKEEIANSIFKITRYDSVFEEVKFKSPEEAKQYLLKLPKLFIAVKEGEVNVLQDGNTLIFYPSSKLAFRTGRMVNDLQFTYTFLSSKDLKLIYDVVLYNQDAGVVGVVNKDGSLVGEVYLTCSDETKKKLEEKGFQLKEVKKGIPVYEIIDSPFPKKYKEGELVEE